MEENKTPAATEKSRDRHWVSTILWSDKEMIRQAAETYDQVKWYKAPRFWPVALVFVLTWISGIVSGKYMDALGASLFLCPLCYLNVKGYRWSILLFAAIYTFEKAYFMYLAVMERSTTNPVVVLIWWLFIAGSSLTAFRIENYRHKHNLAGRGHYLRDALIAITCSAAILVLGSVYFAFYYNSSLSAEQQRDVSFSYAFIIRHTDGISAYCRQHGVTLQKFPARFKENYAREIAVVDDWLNKDEMLKMSMEEYLKENQAALFDVYEKERKYLITRTLAEQTETKMDDFVWEEEYDRLFSAEEYCKTVDESFDAMKSSAMFDIFTATVAKLEQ